MSRGPPSHRALAATANVLATESGNIVYCAKELTRHMANNSRLGEGGEIGEVFEKQTQGSVVVQISRNAVPT